MVAIARRCRCGTRGVASWHQIETSRLPGMASCQSLGREDTAFQGTVLSNCLGSVVRTAWKKAAILSQKRADAQFVGTQ
jgi:hypothetical protein